MERDFKIKWCIFLILFTILNFKLPAKDLTSLAEFRATVADQNWCGETVTVSLHAAAAEHFTNKRTNLEKVARLAKVYLELDCSSMKRIIFKGYTCDSLVYSGQANAADYWALTDGAGKVSENVEQESSEVQALRKRYSQAGKRVRKPRTKKRAGNDSYNRTKSAEERRRFQQERREALIKQRKDRQLSQRYPKYNRTYKKPRSVNPVPGPTSRGQKNRVKYSFPAFTGNPLKDRNYSQSTFFYRENGSEVYFIKYEFRKVQLAVVHDVGPNEPILDLVGSGYKTSYSKKMMNHFKTVTLAKILERAPDARSIIIRHYAKGVYLPDDLKKEKSKIESPLMECYFTRRIPFWRSSELMKLSKSSSQSFNALMSDERQKGLWYPYYKNISWNGNNGNTVAEVRKLREKSLAQQAIYNRNQEKEAEKKRALEKKRLAQLRAQEKQRETEAKRNGYIYKPGSYWQPFNNGRALENIFNGRFLGVSDKELREAYVGFVMEYSERCESHLPRSNREKYIITRGSGYKATTTTIYVEPRMGPRFAEFWRIEESTGKALAFSKMFQLLKKKAGTGEMVQGLIGSALDMRIFFNKEQQCRSKVIKQMGENLYRAAHRMKSLQSVHNPKHGKPREPLSAGVKTYRINVNRLIETKIPVIKGDRIDIKAIGRINFGFAAGSGGPGGINGFTIYNEVRGTRHGALLAKVGDSQGWFLIGTGKSFTIASNGNLLFMVNDRDVSNNSGRFEVTVTVTRK